MILKKLSFSEGKVLKDKANKETKYKKLFDKEKIDKKYDYMNCLINSIISLSVSSMTFILVMINLFTNDKNNSKSLENQKIELEINFNNTFCNNLGTNTFFKALFSEIQKKIIFSELFVILIQIINLFLLIFVHRNLIRFKNFILYFNSFLVGFNILFQFEILKFLCDFNNFIYFKIYFVYYLKAFFTVFWIFKIEFYYWINLFCFIIYMVMCYINNLFYDFHNKTENYFVFGLYLILIISLSIFCEKNSIKQFSKLIKLNSHNKAFLNFINHLDIPVLIFKKRGSIFYNKKYSEQVKNSLSSAMRNIDEVFMKISVFSNLENFNYKLDSKIIEVIKEFQEILSELNIFFLGDEISEIPEEQKIFLDNTVNDLLNFLFTHFVDNQFVFIGTRIPYSFFSLKNIFKIQKVYMRINPLNDLLEIILKSPPSIEEELEIFPFDDKTRRKISFSKNSSNIILDKEKCILNNLSEFNLTKKEISINVNNSNPNNYSNSCLTPIKNLNINYNKEFNNNTNNNNLNYNGIINNINNNSNSVINNLNTLTSNKTNNCSINNENNNINNYINFKNNDRAEIKNSESILHKILSNILRKICHEIRNPILNIIEITKNIKKEINILDNNLLNKVKSIKYICHLLNYTISDFEYLNTVLNASSFSELLENFRNNFEDNEYEFNIKKELSFMKKIFQNKIKLSNKIVNIELNIDSEIPQKLILKFDMINYLLYILLLNSIKFSLKGCIEIKIFLDKKTESLFLIISDEGVGIKEEYLPKIGQQFYKPENSTNTYGLGMGLFIAKIIAEAMTGALVVESKFGMGTTIRIQLPLNNKTSKDYRLLLNNYTIKSEKIFHSPRTFSTLSNHSKKLKKWGTSRTLNRTKVILANSKNILMRNSDTLKSFSEGRSTKGQKKSYSKTTSKVSSRMSSHKNFVYRNTLDSMSKMTSGITNKEDRFYAINYMDLLQKKSLGVGSSNNFEEKREFFPESGMINIYNINLNSSSSVNLRSININSNLMNYTSQNNYLSSNLSQNNFNFYSNNFQGTNPNANQIQQIMQREKFSKNTNEHICRILIVDDEDFIRKSQINVIRKFMKKVNIKPEFEECSDGVECLYKLYYNLKVGIKFDIIFTDETMDFMKGSSMSKIIKELIKENIVYDIKISMITSYDKNYIEKSEFRNYIDFLATKPLSVNVVENIFMKIFNEDF